MEYNYETTNIDIEALEDCCEKLSDDGLKKIALSAKDNHIQLSIILALPHFLMTKSIKDIKHFQYLLEGAVATKNSIHPKTEEGKKQLDDFVKVKFESNEKEHSEEGRKALAKMINNNPYLENAFQIQALNSLAHVWTIFESTTKDIWVYLMNNYQDKFLNNLLEAKTDKEIEGINGKYISISLLGKFGFNINNKLGDILSSKYDFTSCSGIKKAYVDLDKSQKDFFRFLNDRNLFHLELIRNLIVHKAGIVDEIFKNKIDSCVQSVGERILITKNDFGNYENTAIRTIVKLLEFAEEIKATSNSTLPKEGN